MQAPSILGRTTPFDLHVLSTPPAFILSQDQTLKKSFDSFESILGHKNVSLLTFPIPIYCSYLDSFNSEYSLCSTLLNCLKRIFGVVIIILLLKYSHRFRRNRRFVTKSQTQNAKHFQGCVADLLDYSVIKVPLFYFSVLRNKKPSLC